MNKVVNRFCIATGGIFLIACGLFPKLAALISIMPQSVLGGAAVMMFSSIVVSGIQLITKWPIGPRNVTIVSVALGLGYGLGSNTAILVHLPQAISLIFGGSGIVPAAVFAIILNIFPSFSLSTFLYLIHLVHFVQKMLLYSQSQLLYQILCLQYLFQLDFED